MLTCLQFRIENSLTSVTFYVSFAVVSSILEKKKHTHTDTPEGAIITCFVICELENLFERHHQISAASPPPNKSPLFYKVIMVIHSTV